MAWQTSVERVLNKEQRSHVLIARVDGTDQSDLGEGNTPAFVPDNKSVVFVRYRDKNLELVRYDIETRSQEVSATKHNHSDFFEDPFEDPYGLTIGPDGTTIVLSACCGRYGSALFWRLLPDQSWKSLDDNLGAWGGWTQGGLLVYDTDGHDLRQLVPKKGVWVSDIRIFALGTGFIRTNRAGGQPE
jgi:Tol biopolymer transport system component